MTAGWTQLIYAALFVLSVALILYWRSFLNYVWNIEATYSVDVINAQGDAIYRQSRSLLPLLWPIRETEVFMSMSAKDGLIENPTANWPVIWTEKTPRCYRGKVLLPPHRPLLFRFGKPAGIRVEVSAHWRRAFAAPPFDFVVATGERPSGRIEIQLRWRREAKPLEARAEHAVFPVGDVRESAMIRTDRVPWFVESSVTAQKDGDDMLMTYVIFDPRPSRMFRIAWRY